MIKAAYQMVGHNFNNDRIENDFYATPLDAIKDLIKYEKFDGKIWECSCGNGAISKPLIDNGYDVYSSDLIDRGYGDVKDFLKITPSEVIDENLTALKRLVIFCKGNNIKLGMFEGWSEGDSGQGDDWEFSDYAKRTRN